MFLDNKYTKWYNAIIEAAQAAARKKTKRLDPHFVYLESHHIVPKSLGGSNDPSNLVLLTAKEHFVCHLLLVKMVHEKYHFEKMYKSLMRFRYGNAGAYSSRMYDVIKTKYAKHPRKPKSEEFREMKRQAWTKNNPSTWVDRTGANNGMFGVDRSGETELYAKVARINKARLLVDNPMASQENRAKVSLSKVGRKKMVHPNFTKGKYVKPELFEEHIQMGWGFTG